MRTCRSRTVAAGYFVALSLAVVSVKPLAQTRFQLLSPNVIESRLGGFSEKNDQREIIIKQWLQDSGCRPGYLSEQTVKGRLPPNVICSVPGQTERVILVGAHTDHADVGEGVVDNWSGASLLPSLLYSLSGQPRQHTFVFVGFSAEEKGMLGSEFYVEGLSAEQRAKIDGMVNLDTLGLGPTKVWATHADQELLRPLIGIAASMKLPLAAVNVDRVGTTDSESFARLKIPRITIHSVTQETWSILHSPRDNMRAIRLDDYYASYRLLAGYLAFLDTHLGPVAPSTEKPAH